MLGFTVLGGSVAVIAPLSFSAAAVVAGGGLDPEARRARVDAVIARFNQFNYVGGLLGAVLTGVVGSQYAAARVRRAHGPRSCSSSRWPAPSAPSRPRRHLTDSAPDHRVPAEGTTKGPSTA